MPVFIFLTLLLAILTLPAGLINAQSGTATVTDDEVNEIARELYCPVCESTPLDVCPTQACADWREIIRTKLAEGETEQEIKDYFAEQYGPRALAEPPQEGFTLAVWIIPIAAVMVGGFFFSRYIRSIQTSGTSTVTENPPDEMITPQAKPAPDDYIARVEKELKERRE